MKIVVCSLVVASFCFVACGSKEGNSGAEVLTSRFDPGHFQLLECKDPQGKVSLTVNMIVGNDQIKGITIDDKVNVFPIYDFKAATERETDEGAFTDVALAKRKSDQKAILSWNLEQGIVSLRRDGKVRLDWSGCSIKNQRVWESLSLDASVE